MEGEGGGVRAIGPKYPKMERTRIKVVQSLLAVIVKAILGHGGQE